MVSYFGRNPATLEVFRPAGGWCDFTAQGLGVHCSRDVRVPRLYFDRSALYGLINPEFGVPNPYPPTAMVLHVLARALEWMGAGEQGSMASYLVLAAVALLAPVLWVVLTRRGAQRDWLPIVIIGAATAPFLTTLDRENSSAFMVPFLLLFALFVRDDPRWLAPVAAVCAASVRPQFLLIGLVLMAFGRIRAAAAAAAAWVALTLALFAVLPGGFITNIRGWWSDVGRLQSSVDVASDIPLNPSASHALTLVGDGLAGLQGLLGAVGAGLTDAVRAYPSVPGAVLVLLAVVTVLLAPAPRHARPCLHCWPNAADTHAAPCLLLLPCRCARDRRADPGPFPPRIHHGRLRLGERAIHRARARTPCGAWIGLDGARGRGALARARSALRRAQLAEHREGVHGACLPGCGPHSPRVDVAALPSRSRRRSRRCTRRQLGFISRA